MLRVFLRNPVTQFCLVVILLTVFAGVFAPLLAPHDPYENNILMKFASPSWEYPLGTDQLGRCVFSRMLYGIRPTFFLSLLTMAGTIGLGLLMGVLAGYFRGPIDEFIMRVVDVMLSFPSQIMILAVVALMGVNIENVIIANIFIKWAWYARMNRTLFCTPSPSVLGITSFSRITCCPALLPNLPFSRVSTRAGPF